MTRSPNTLGAHAPLYLAILTVAAAGLGTVGCSGAGTCSTDDDCFKGQTCVDQTCTPIEDASETGPTDAGDADNADTDPSPNDTEDPTGGETGTDTASPDTAGADTSPATDTDDGRDTADTAPADTGTTDTSEMDAGSDTSSPACVNPSGICSDDPFEHAPFPACATKDLDQIGGQEGNDSCKYSAGCNADFESKTNAFDGVLCPSDEADEFKLLFDECETDKRLVTIQLQRRGTSKTCPRNLFRLEYDDSHADQCDPQTETDQELNCQYRNDKTTLEFVIPPYTGAPPPVVSHKLGFKVVPDCEDEGECPIELKYRLSIDVTNQ